MVSYGMVGYWISEVALDETNVIKSTALPVFAVSEQL